MSSSLSRRELLGATGAVLLGSRFVQSAGANESTADGPTAAPFRYCLNTSTVRGQNLGIVRQVEVAAEAGYDAIEPWMRDLAAFTEAGGSLSDLRKRIADAGLTVDSAIGFAKWIVDDDAERQRGLEEAQRDMDVLRQIGGMRIAAPPAGATGEAGLDLFRAAERYHALCELGRRMDVVPQLEVWGFSKNLSRLSESTFVAIESGHPQACLLPDVYHLHKGGSDFAGMKLLGPRSMHVFHVNDYPADPPRETLRDADRVYPGDGVAPLGDILRTLRDIGFHGTLSLELFNPEYWQQDALTVAKTGLEKTRNAVEQALKS
ncbi:MAG: sugar phosphate isomerase/epimerase family protein [Planctomycetaceae bacterium]